MDTTSYLTLSLARSMQTNLDVIANNIANAGTAGFRVEQPVFESFLHHTTQTERRHSVSFVAINERYLDTSPGSLVTTGNPTDFAISGDAFFAYRTAEGQLAYGRDGRLMVDVDGNFITASGHQILGVDGDPIFVPPEEVGGLVVGRDGVLSNADGAVLGRIGMFDAGNINGLTRISGGLFLAPGDAALVPQFEAGLLQGAFEESNVQPVLEMTRMMQVQSAYDRATKIISDRNDLQKTFLERLGRVA